MVPKTSYFTVEYETFKINLQIEKSVRLIEDISEVEAYVCGSQTGQTWGFVATTRLQSCNKK